TYMWHPAAAGTLSYGTADNGNKYPSVGGVGYSYNGNKCLTGDGVWTFGYDTENHLLTATKTGTSASFVYDPLHRQSQKTVGSTKTRYVYSGWQRIADYNGTSGALQRRYVYGTGLDEPLIIVTGSTPTFLHHDKVGSIVAVSNNSGAVANKNKFSPFGEITTLGGTTVGFTGQRYDSELGLYYFKHRYYSPKLGRFLQPDPIGYTGRDFNLYTYVGNSPQTYTDPMGLQWCWIPGKGDPVDSYIPWYDNPTGMSGADWFAQFGLTFAQGARFDWGRKTGDGATPGLVDWLVPGAQRSKLFSDDEQDKILIAQILNNESDEPMTPEDFIIRKELEMELRKQRIKQIQESGDLQPRGNPDTWPDKILFPPKPTLKQLLDEIYGPTDPKHRPDPKPDPIPEGDIKHGPYIT
ncbi:MAG: RHS repeat-associated core domain-containing protein, partial [Candidatus Obscuribacter sp.]|nr:RHS repeat-associated core domain-containing protein [Candidatus Obscuribacter sp.]